MSLTIPVPVQPSSTSISKRPALTPTPQQQAFLDALTTSSSHIILQARAGCGKTSAILMGVDTYLTTFPGSEVLVCAYNKAIQTEVQEKLTARGYDWKDVQCQTVHGMGMSLLKSSYRPRVEEGKMWRILDSLKEHENRTHPLWQFGSQIVQLVGLGKQSGVGFFDDLPIGDRSIWYDIADHYDVAAFEPGVDMDAVVTWAEKLYRQSLEIVDEIDFNDMVLFPLIKGLRVKYRKDLILGDEIQDWSRTRQAIVRMFLKNPGGRLAGVGDDKQAIYGFSGADAQAMENMTREMNATVLPLSVTWRCPKKVVEVAQRIVPDLQAADTAPEGEVLFQSALFTRSEGLKITGFEIQQPDTPDAFIVPTVGATKNEIYLEDLVPGQDALLCRNTAPLIPLAYRIIRAGIPAKVEGRKLGEGLIELVNRWSIKTTSALRNKLLDYRDRETAKWNAKGKEQKAEEAEDRVSTILAVVEECEKRGRHDVQSVVEFIERLFGDNVKGAVTLCTYHRSKGREWDRVLLLEHSSRCPSRAARQEWQLEQERNLAYVSFTRAKRTLVFVG